MGLSLRTAFAGAVLLLGSAIGLVVCTARHAEPPQPDRPIAPPSAAALTDFRARRTDIENHIRACQISTTDYGPDFARGQPTAIYAQATYFRDGCEGAGMYLDEVRFGSVYDPGAVRLLDSAIAACAKAVRSRRQAFADVVQAADSSFRPSKVATAKAALESSDKKIEACMMRLAADAARAGLSDPRSRPAAAQPQPENHRARPDQAAGPSADQSSQVDALITEYYELNETCRGGGESAAATDDACRRRGRVSNKLQSLGLCWTEKPDAPSAAEAEAAWKSCPRGLANASSASAAPQIGSDRSTSAQLPPRAERARRNQTPRRPC